MKAVGYRQSLPIDQAGALLDVVLPDPKPKARDLLVSVRAVSVNPVDVKMRMRATPAPGETNVLGWDAAGVVEAVGPDVMLFKPGDEVWYAGAIGRAGTNSELHVVDERIVGLKPTRLSFAQAAALPLTSITAWELLFDRLQVTGDGGVSEPSILVIGAGGGVGSILVQLARRLTALKVIATAGRPSTHDWLKSLGAHEVIDHGQPLAAELQRIGHPQVSHVASLNQSQAHFAAAVECLAPQGKFGLIDDPTGIDIALLKRKSLSLHWELMFTRSIFETADMQQQHRLLTEVASLVDAGTIRTTLAAHFGTINAANLIRAHALLESGQSRGKIVLEGF